MNLRDKFIWNVALAFAFGAIAWCSWSLYNMNYDSNQLLKNYKQELVGTDEKLQNKVTELEEIYTYRNNIKFKVNDNPFDLSRVMGFTGSFRGGGNLRVSGIVDHNGSPMAIINYKDKKMNVVKGDSIAGGVIKNITSTEVTYRKNEQLYYFNLGIDNNIE